MEKQTIQEFFKQFSSDDICLEHLFNVRFGKNYLCPKCERAGKWYRGKSRPVYYCQWCGHHVRPMVGTPFEASRTSLQLWFFAIYLFTKTRSGVSAKELERQLGVTYKCAYRMGHEIRKHMANVDGDPPLDGEVEVDETLIGGHNPRDKGKPRDNKAILFGMLDRDGDVMTKVVPDTKVKTLYPIIRDNVKSGSTIYSDEHPSYESLGTSGYKHESVHHKAKEYARGDAHVNTMESYWARLKSSINGTHVHVSPKHLQKYAGEFEYRFNNRNNPENMLPELLSNFPKDKK